MKYNSSPRMWSEENIEKECRKLISEHGEIPAAGWLTQNGFCGMMEAIRSNHNGLLAYKSKLYGLAVKRKSSPRKWTRDNIKVECEKLIAKHGQLPVAGWLAKNGYSGMLHTLEKDYGGLHSFRRTLHTSEVSRMICRGGLRHDSFAEVCIANFVWSRGIEYNRGRRYPYEYEEMSGKASGHFDLEFVAINEPFDGQLILVEVWGAKREKLEAKTRGIRDEEYLRTRILKEKFNKNNENFIGIEYDDCYKEEKLRDILRPYIGDPPVIEFRHEHDKFFTPATWTVADDVLHRCQVVIDNIENGVLPPIDWFLKQRNFANRETFDWELYWTDLPDKFTRLGGIVKVREYLGQSRTCLTNKHNWDRNKVIEYLIDFITTHKEWPSTIASRLSLLPEKSTIEVSLLREASNLSNNARTHIGSAVEVQSLIMPMLDFDIRPMKIHAELPMGIRWNDSKTKLIPRITVKGKRVELGTFDTIEEAVARLDLAKSAKKEGRPVK